MVIGLDCDSTINDITTGRHGAYNAAFNDDLCDEKVKGWDVHSYCKGGKSVYEYLTDSVIRYAPLRPKAYEVIHRLYDEHKVYLVTATFPEHVKTRYEWLAEFLPFIDPKRLIFIHDKHILDLDVLVDDGLHNLEGFAHYIPIVYDQPWNRSNTNLARAYNWGDVDHLIDYFSRMGEVNGKKRNPLLIQWRYYAIIQ